MAVLAAPGRQPVLAIGSGDNDDLYSPDGGVNWNYPNRLWCGDCGDWWTDTLNPTWALAAARGEGTLLRQYKTIDLSADPSRRDYPLMLMASPADRVLPPFRMVIQTKPDERPLAQDYVYICCQNLSPRVLARANDVADVSTSSS